MQPDLELELLRLEDQQVFLDRIAKRNNTESVTNGNLAVSRVHDARARMYIALAGVATSASLAGIGWSVWYWVTH
jgi:hypothetical protein